VIAQASNSVCADSGFGVENLAVDVREDRDGVSDRWHARRPRLWRAHFEEAGRDEKAGGRGRRSDQNVFARGGRLISAGW